MYTPNVQLLEQWVSRDRLTRYRKTSESTAELYLWNAELAAAYFEIIGHAEILLRNVFHKRLSPHSADERWYVDTERFPFNDHAKHDVKTAIRRATKGGLPEYPGKVIAELSFGFWRFLLSKKYQSTIWPVIAPGFTGVPAHKRRRHELENAAKRINELRNRVAHHEPVFHNSHERYLEDIYTIAHYVDARAESMLRNRSRVLEVLDRRPTN